MTKHQRHAELIQRLDAINQSVNEVFKTLNMLGLHTTHPERSAFGPPEGQYVGATSKLQQTNERGPYGAQPFAYQHQRGPSGETGVACSGAHGHEHVINPHLEQIIKERDLSTQRQTKPPAAE